MEPKVQPEHLDDDESEDEDFQPDVQDNASEASASSDDGDYKRKAKDDEIDSGDEATMKSFKKRKGDAAVSTRSMRSREPVKQVAAPPKESTADVDALWKSMNVGQTKTDNASGMVTIKRTYEFAGDILTEEKQVPADSEEAKAFFSAKSEEAKKAARRPTKRTSTLEASLKKPTKMNTLEKSKLDWREHVGQEGMEEDLKNYNKGGYLQRQDFLQRVSQRQDADLKASRKK